MNYPGWKMHEYKAFNEFVEKYDVKYTFKAFYDQKAVLIINEISHN